VKQNNRDGDMSRQQAGNMGQGTGRNQESELNENKDREFYQEIGQRDGQVWSGNDENQKDKRGEDKMNRAEKSRNDRQTRDRQSDVFVE
jgi:general stress protein YciG